MYTANGGFTCQTHPTNAPLLEAVTTPEGQVLMAVGKKSEPDVFLFSPTGLSLVKVSPLEGRHGGLLVSPGSSSLTTLSSSGEIHTLGCESWPVPHSDRKSVV